MLDRIPLILHPQDGARARGLFRARFDGIWNQRTTKFYIPLVQFDVVGLGKRVIPHPLLCGDYETETEPDGEVNLLNVPHPKRPHLRMFAIIQLKTDGDPNG